MVFELSVRYPSHLCTPVNIGAADAIARPSWIVESTPTLPVPPVAFTRGHPHFPTRLLHLP